MITDLQKASLWKRVSAGLFDLILVAMLAVGMAVLLSWAFGYNTHSQNLNDAYSRYEAQYGVEFQMTQQAFDALPQEQTWLELSSSPLQPSKRPSPQHAAAQESAP